MSEEPEILKESSPGVALKRDISLTLLIFYGVGTILGLGIYVLTGKIAGEAGMLAPFAFVVAAVLAAFTGLSYGELSARIPKSAGEVNYIDEAFHNRSLARLVGWLIVLSAMISTSTVVNGYVGYFQVFVSIPDWTIITGITLLLSGVAAWGIKESAYTIAVITIIEISGILTVIIIAGDNLGLSSETLRELVPNFTFADWKMVMAGAFLAFFAFIGFEDMVNVAEEVRNPQKTMPVAIIVSLAILTILYILVEVIAVNSLSIEALNQSEAPLSDIVAAKGDFYPKIIGAISLVAIVNGVLVQIIMGARVMYGMAEKSLAPEALYKVNPVTHTPLRATVVMAAVVLVLALSFDLETLAKATNFILLAVFVLVNASLWVLKQREPKPSGVRTYPKWVPALGFLFSFLVLAFETVVSITELL